MTYHFNFNLLRNYLIKKSIERLKFNSQPAQT